VKAKKSKVKKVTVLLEGKKQMRDKKGRLWMGENPTSAKLTDFKKIKTIRVQKALPKHIRKPTERHEYIEAGLEKKGASYKVAHRKALKLEKKPIKGVRFVERKAKTKRGK
jgi:hypothetical protein